MSKQTVSKRKLQRASKEKFGVKCIYCKKEMYYSNKNPKTEHSRGHFFCANKKCEHYGNDV